MRVFDCVTFFNEIDLLQLRLKLLNDVVDYTVVVESNLTFSGKPKPYYFEENRQMFQQWSEKIIYIPIEQSTEGLTFKDVKTYSPDNGPFQLEYQQRNAMSYINEIINDDDLCMISDLDEMPNPLYVDIARGVKIKQPYSFVQLFHYYFMNCQNTGFDRWWKGTVMCPGKYFKDNTPQYIRDHRNDYPPVRSNGIISTQNDNLMGWHFSFLGGIEKIRNKIQSFAHTEFNRPDITSEHNITEAMEKGKDVFNRPGVSYKFHPVSDYPEYLQKLMLEYPQFVKSI